MGHVKVTEILIEKGADIYSYTKEGYTALQEAYDADEPMTIQVLKRVAFR